MREILKNIFLFKNLPDDDIVRLEAISKLKHYSTGDILFYEGDSPLKIYLLTEGIVKIYKTDLKENEIIIHQFHPVSLVAEMANLYKMPFPATAEFETNGCAIEINYTVFEDEFIRNPKISFEIVKSLSQKIKFLENIITTHMTLDSTSRIAKFLYENETVYRETKQNKIAMILNITPETLSRALKKFKTLGLVSDESRNFTILNRDGLRAIFS
jgi:CRP/FNR family transcriptional regulator